MTRRQLLAFTTGLLPIACRPKSSTGKDGRRSLVVGKKGLCLSDKMRSPGMNSRFIQTVGAHWLYNWNTEAPDKLPAGVAYSPMIYRPGGNLDAQIARVKAQATSRGFTELLGFNEPDAKSQGNATVQEALAAWPKLEATGLRLGSPATVHPDNDWMVGFMEGVEQRGLRVDFVCLHSYGGPGVDSFLAKIERIHAMFQRPIWITEFAVADWSAKSAAENRFEPERVADFVSRVLPKLEALEFVERYAWFHGGISGGPLASSRLFLPDGSLTVVGEAYRSMGFKVSNGMATEASLSAG